MKGIPSFRNQKKLKKRSGSVMVAQETSNTSKSNGSSDLVQESAIRDFLEKFDKESEDSNMLNFEFLEIRKEQTSFQATEEFRCSVGQKIAHFVRNRYRDILPYDKTRVLLSASPDNADGYINASHISHPDTSYMYIAAQAPLSSTVEDFWQMAFEQNATIVGMLCKCVENGMPKCERYWGDDEANRDICDNISAYTIEEKAFEDFAYRKLKVSSEKYGVTDKVIHQLHYTEWPDHGCPNGEKNVLEFMDVLNKLKEESNNKGPILLHCSAGCGRTGSVIAIDIFRELLTSKKLTEINLKQLVLELRKQRVCMVQTPGQYQFLHKCIAHYCKQYMGLVMKNVPESNSTTAKEESSNGLFSGKDMPDEKAANLDSGATTAATSENEHNAIDVRF